MRVLPAKSQSAVRQAVPEPQPAASAYTFPAPIRGLVLNENIANASPAGAKVLDNWVCTPSGVRVRGGAIRHATLPGPVTAMFTYSGAGANIFAATETDIYDVTLASPLTATVSLGSMTGGDYSTAMFGTAGGVYLYIVNGEDAPRHFDGTTWATPTITGATASDFSHVWSYANRLFFIVPGSMTAHYLPTDSLQGTVNQYSLAGTFKRGGSLLFGANWSLDASDGMDDKCVFISTEGEAAVFSGTDPNTASEWRLEGVYYVGRPLGRNAIMKVGGELVIATELGLIPLSKAIATGTAALAQAAASSRIEPLWSSYADTQGAWWSISTAGELMLVAMPSDTDDGPLLCCNLNTGGWSRWTGVDANALTSFNGAFFSGKRDGRILRLDAGGNDDGDAYTAHFIGNSESMGLPGIHKSINQARALFVAAHDVAPQVTVQVDYTLREGSVPPALPFSLDAGVWDSSLWDAAIWDASTATRAVTSRWRGVGRSGYAVAPELQMTFDSLFMPQVEFVSIDMTFTAGVLVS